MVEVWSEDEARLGLQPIIRRRWAEAGKRPLASQCRRYQWLYAYAFVHPATGTSEWFLLPWVNTAAMQTALDEFAKAANPSSDKIIVVLVDQAGWHLTSELAVPDGIVLYPLPPYSPELQPAECLWPLLREGVANRSFDDLDELESVLVPRCRQLMRDIQTVRGATGFSWIVEAERLARD